MSSSGPLMLPGALWACTAEPPNGSASTDDNRAIDPQAYAAVPQYGTALNIVVDEVYAGAPLQIDAVGAPVTLHIGALRGRIEDQDLRDVVEVREPSATHTVPWTAAHDTAWWLVVVGSVDGVPGAPVVRLVREPVTQFYQSPFIIGDVLPPGVYMDLPADDYTASFLAAGGHSVTATVEATGDPVRVDVEEPDGSVQNFDASASLETWRTGIWTLKTNPATEPATISWTSEPASVPETWCVDADLDHYGDPERCRQTLVPAHDEVSADRVDCDDQDAAVRPTGVDLCGDGVDGNCAYGDPACYEPSIELTDVAAFAWMTIEWPAGVDESTLGVTTIRDQDGDGRADVLVDVGGLVEWHPSAPGTVYAGNGASSLLGFDSLRVARDGAADLDGDGLDEWILADPDMGQQTGAILIWPAAHAVAPAAEAPWSWVGTENGAIGSSVASAADLTGDDVSDVLSYESGTDALLVLSTPTEAKASTDTARRVTGDASRPGTNFEGTRDLDGDGLADLWVNAQSGSEGWVLSGPLADVAPVEAAWAGFCCAALVRAFTTADADGDGIADLWVWSDGAAGQLTLHTQILPGPQPPDGGVATVGAGMAALGHAVAPGDLDADGEVDITVSNHVIDGGAVWFGPGPFAGALSLDDWVPWDGDGVGYDLIAIGDLDGGDVADLAIVANDAVYLVQGGPW